MALMTADEEHAMRQRLRTAELGAREVIARWMMERGYATGHGDTIEHLLSELVGQVRRLYRPLGAHPAAFRAPNGRGGSMVTQDEREAIDVAEAAGADYDCLYLRNAQANPNDDRKGEPRGDPSPESNTPSGLTDPIRGGEVT